MNKLLVNWTCVLAIVSLLVQGSLAASAPATFGQSHAHIPERTQIDSDNLGEEAIKESVDQSSSVSNRSITAVAAKRAKKIAMSLGITVGISLISLFANTPRSTAAPLVASSQLPAVVSYEDTPEVVQVEVLDAELLDAVDYYSDKVQPNSGNQIYLWLTLHRVGGEVEEQPLEGLHFQMLRNDSKRHTTIKALGQESRDVIFGVDLNKDSERMRVLKALESSRNYFLSRVEKHVEMSNLHESLSIPLGEKLLNQSGDEDTATTYALCKVGRGSEVCSVNEKLGQKTIDLKDGYYIRVRAGSFLDPSYGQIVASNPGKKGFEIVGVIFGIAIWIGAPILGFWAKSSRHKLAEPKEKE